MQHNDMPPSFIVFAVSYKQEESILVRSLNIFLKFTSKSFVDSLHLIVPNNKNISMLKNRTKEFQDT